MRSFALLLLLACAPAWPVGFDEARHLLARTGFGPTGEEIQALREPAYDEAVERLVAAAAAHARPVTPPPAWAGEPAHLAPKEPDARRTHQRQRRAELRELQRWWLTEIIATPQPLAERMTLFWHNHFTTSYRKVRKPPFLYRQNLLLRRHALGNFRTFLHDVARDPAMVEYLDTQSNRKGAPNENFARELLELFTLGEGHYSEADIQEAARAFSGWSVDRSTGAFRILKGRHDDGEKTFLGKTGRLDGDEVIDIILAQPRCAEFIVGKLWREFVSETANPERVRELAAVFRRDYAIAPVLVALLRTPEFRAAAARGRLVKSPVELVAGTYRVFGAQPADGAAAVTTATQLGQSLFDPPNVKGWPGGTAWIDSRTLLDRLKFVESMSRGFDARGAMRGEGRSRQMAAAGDLDTQVAAFASRFTPQQQQAILLPIPPVIPAAEGADLHAQLRALLADPAYQLK